MDIWAFRASEMDVVIVGGRWRVVVAQCWTVYMEALPFRALWLCRAPFLSVGYTSPSVWVLSPVACLPHWCCRCSPGQSHRFCLGKRSKEWYLESERQQNMSSGRSAQGLGFNLGCVLWHRCWWSFPSPILALWHMLNTHSAMLLQSQPISCS